MSSRPISQQGPSPDNDQLFDVMMFNDRIGTSTVRGIINDLILRGAQILHMKYLESQINHYASNTLSLELVMNTSSALAPIDDGATIAEPDDDLDLPEIDEWAGGVLPVTNTESQPLRTSITPHRETKRSNASVRSKRAVDQGNDGNTSMQQQNPAVIRQTKPTERMAPEQKRRSKQQLSDSQLITQIFDDAKKKVNSTMKSVTVDSDFNVIQIQEPKNLPPTLIIPKVVTKKSNVRDETHARTYKPKHPVVFRTPEKKPPRKQLVSIVSPDSPTFDEEVTDVPISEKFVAAPGVTLREGSVVKSRPQVHAINQMTRTQYEAYLTELRGSY